MTCLYKLFGLILFFGITSLTQASSEFPHFKFGNVCYFKYQNSDYTVHWDFILNDGKVDAKIVLAKDQKKSWTQVDLFETEWNMVPSGKSWAFFQDEESKDTYGLLIHSHDHREFSINQDTVPLECRD